MGKEMAALGYVPELIVSSPAERALQTAKHVINAAGFDAELIFDRSIYAAGLNTLYGVVGSIPDDYSSSMITGHNPGFEQLVHSLIGEYRRMPTAALAVIDIDIHRWSDLRMGSGKLRDYLIPKELPKIE